MIEEKDTRTLKIIIANKMRKRRRLEEELEKVNKEIQELNKMINTLNVENVEVEK